jgi:hypothetical protein
VLVGAAALFAVHPPPIGPIGLVCLAAAAVLLQRAHPAATKSDTGALSADAGPAAVPT